jgi:hypothetical protein
MVRHRGWSGKRVAVKKIVTGAAIHANGDLSARRDVDFWPNIPELKSLLCLSLELERVSGGLTQNNVFPCQEIGHDGQVQKFRPKIFDQRTRMTAINLYILDWFVELICYQYVGQACRHFGTQTF